MSDRAMTTDLAARALDVNEAQFLLGNESFIDACARFVRNIAYPDIRDANHVSHVTASTPDEVDALLARADETFAHAPHRAYHTDFRTPPAFEARLALDGYQSRATLVLMLEGALEGTPRQFDIRPVASEDDWAAFERLHALDWAEARERLGQTPAPDVGLRMARSRRLKCPPAQYYLAYESGEARGYFSTLPGVDGMAQVEDLFVDPAWRHRGIATALIHHCVDACRRAGSGPIVITADVDDTPKDMYAALGFRPVAVKRDWWRATDPT